MDIVYFSSYYNLMEKIERPFKKDAQELVDMLFDKGLFIKGITRKHMRVIQNLIEYNMDSKYKTYVRCKEIMAKIDLSKLQN